MLCNIRKARKTLLLMHYPVRMFLHQLEVKVPGFENIKVLYVVDHDFSEPCGKYTSKNDGKISYT